MKIKNLILAAVFLSASHGLPAQTLQYHFKDWVAAHLEYPQAAYERMYEASIPVAFKVAADGTIFDVECRADLRGESDMIRQMADAAVKAVASAPKWLPATEGSGRPEDYSLMVEFEMPKFGADMEVVPGFGRPEWVSEEYHRSYNKLTAWIASQISVPEDFHISLTAIIEKGGTLGHTKIISTSDEAVAAKVLEVIDRAPEWTPETDHDGEPMRVFRHIYLQFGSGYNEQENDDEGNYEVMPAFRGGDTQKFREWFTKRLVYPQNGYANALCGTVLLRFVIDKQGQVGDIEVLHSPNEALTRAAIHVLRRSPKWTPGLDADGKPTRVYYILPIHFYLPR